MHVIVVDPNAAFATLLTEELERLGYNATACGSGEDAVVSARTHSPDLALVDMSLDDPGPFTAARRLRDLNPEMRLIFIPLMGQELQVDGDAPPFQGVLPKPFFLPDLPKHIEQALAAPVAAASGSSPSPSVLTPASSEPTPARPQVEDEVGVKADARLSPETVDAHRARVEGLMRDLMMDVGANGVFLTGSHGLLAWVGDMAEQEVASLSQAVLHGWQTSAEVARILGREQVRFEQSIAGGSYMLYALSVRDAILAVTVDGASTLGLLRHRARATAKDIARLCGP